MCQALLPYPATASAVCAGKAESSFAADLRLRCTLGGLQLRLSSQSSSDSSHPASAEPGEVQLLLDCQDLTLLHHSWQARDAFLFPARLPPPPGSFLDVSVVSLRSELSRVPPGSTGMWAEAEQCSRHQLLALSSLHMEVKLIRSSLSLDVQSGAVSLQASPASCQGAPTWPTETSWLGLLHGFSPSCMTAEPVPFSYVPCSQTVLRACLHQRPACTAPRDGGRACSDQWHQVCPYRGRILLHMHMAALLTQRLRLQG